MERTLPLLELRSQAEGVVTGLAASFGGIDSYGDSIAPGAFAATLDRHSNAKTAPAMLWAHHTDAPIGRWEALAETPRGLVAKGRLNLRTPIGQAAYEHLKAGDIGGLSIGYNVPAGGFVMQTGGVRLLKAIDLHEVSVVCLPADLDARVQSVKAELIDPEPPATLRELERALLGLGYTRREAAAIAAKGFAGFDPPTGPNPDFDPVEFQHFATALLALKAALSPKGKFQ